MRRKWDVKSKIGIFVGYYNNLKGTENDFLKQIIIMYLEIFFLEWY